MTLKKIFSAPWPERAHGFTLVEVLLALFMFVIIAGVIFGSFSAVSSGVERGRQSIELYHVGRAVMHRMSQEIGAAVYFSDDPRTTMRGKSGSADKYPRDHISFVVFPFRRLDPTTPESDLCEVAYYIAEIEQGGLALVRDEDCTLDEEREDGTRLIMTDLVAGLDIVYVSPEALEEEWPPGRANETAPLPWKIQIALTLRDAQQYERTFSTTIALPMGAGPSTPPPPTP